jgi:predicted small metal-binding protein
MSRMTIDCRSVPSESGCSLSIAGEEDEVMRAATAHAVDVHGHTDGEELRAALRASLVPEVAAVALGEGAFVQVIEFSTTRLAEFQEIEDRWRDEIGADRTARWAITGADRNAPDRYLQVVGFPDHEAAMANSKHPVTGRFAEQLMALCDGEPVFHDLDVLHPGGVSGARGWPGCSGRAPASCRSPRPSPSRPTPASSGLRAPAGRGTRSRRPAPCRGSST